MNTIAKDRIETPVSDSRQAARLLREDLTSLDHEESWVLFLNSANLPLGKKMMTMGTLRATPMDNRRIIKEALMCNASAIIVFHNHPSGNPSPSTQDISMTERLRKACDLFDINLVDHIIVADGAFYSFADESTKTFMK